MQPATTDRSMRRTNDAKRQPTRTTKQLSLVGDNATRRQTQRTSESSDISSRRISSSRTARSARRLYLFVFAIVKITNEHNSKRIARRRHIRHTHTHTHTCLCRSGVGATAGSGEAAAATPADRRPDCLLLLYGFVCICKGRMRTVFVCFVCVFA
jgi:hypothetical protein